MKWAIEQDIEDLLKEIFHEEWLTTSEYDTLIDLCLKASNVSVESLTAQVNDGVSKGYSIEQQLDYLKVILNKQ
tara:strand:- start:404 stop:625 length:222 start_codon:yes stop_codon:yes gene_type:complete